MVEYQCELCGSINNLVMHHTSYEPEKYQILCKSCHSKVHHSIRVSKKPPRITEKLTVVLSEETEERLRNVAKKKGDLSEIVETALKMWLPNEEAVKHE